MSKKTIIDSLKYHKDCIDLVQDFNNNNLDLNEDNTLIIGVARGGLQLAQYFSYGLNIRNVSSVNSILYEGEEKTNNHVILGLENMDLTQWSNILIVDDIYDTGDTMELIFKEVSLRAPYATVLKVCTYTKQDKPDIIYQEYFEPNEWIVFPWDILEKQVT